VIKRVTANRLAELNEAMRSLDQMGSPKACWIELFQMLRSKSPFMLNGAVALSYLDIETIHRRAWHAAGGSKVIPNNAQWVYGHGSGFADGKNRDQYRGYWYMARAANF